MKNTRDYRLGRLLLLYIFIQRGNTINLRLLARKFNCSVRTIYRDLEKIRKASNAVEPIYQDMFNDTLFR